MAFEEVLKTLQSQDVTWDDVRERRVFNRIREELAVAPAEHSPRAPRVALAALGGLAAVLLVGLVGFWVFDGSGESGVKSGSVVASLEPTQSTNPSTMVIRDVGQVQLMDGAQVAIWQQTRHTVKLRQTKGKAVYEIEHRSGREVFVYAGEVEIRVVGTVFTVEMSGELLNVHVRRGFVRINDGERLVELRSGEEISVAMRSRGVDSANQISRNEDSDKDLGSDNSAEKNDLDETETVRNREKGQTTRHKQGKSLSRSSTKQLFEQVDQARKGGELNQASKILGVIIARNDDRSSVVSALFILGKVERARNRQIQAAKAFSRCFRLGSGGPLAEDALAESAAAWSAAQKTDKAKEAAQNYIKRYPSGIHAERMNKILK